MLDPDFLLERLTLFVPLVLSLTVHEWAHAWTAWRLGDDTARLQGRVSLNPLEHIDPIGTVLLPLLGVPFGWAKPVPINPLRFRPNIRVSTGMMLTAAAGPVANFLLAVIGCLCLAALAAGIRTGLAGGGDQALLTAIYQLLYVTIIINVMLACFNLLPIPPLDGSRIVDGLLPASLRPVWNQFSALGPLVLVAVILLPVFLGVSIWSPLLRHLSSLIQALTAG